MRKINDIGQAVEVLMREMSLNTDAAIRDYYLGKTAPGHEIHGAMISADRISGALAVAFCERGVFAATYIGKHTRADDRFRNGVVTLDMGRFGISQGDRGLKRYDSHNVLFLGVKSYEPFAHEERPSVAFQYARSLFASR